MAMSSAERAKRSRALKAFHARRRNANERRGETLRDYWNSEDADYHREKLSRAMKRYWRNRKVDAAI